MDGGVMNKILDTMRFIGYVSRLDGNARREWLTEFRVGWRRRSRLLLDNCALPARLIYLRCPTPKYLQLNWGAILDDMRAILAPKDQE